MRRRAEDYAKGEQGLLDNTKDFIIEASVYFGRSPEEDLPSDVAALVY